jgi:hypothetical protein
LHQISLIIHDLTFALIYLHADTELMYILTRWRTHLHALRAARYCFGLGQAPTGLRSVRRVRAVRCGIRSTDRRGLELVW